jgi:cytochrome c551/c552
MSSHLRVRAGRLAIAAAGITCALSLAAACARSAPAARPATAAEFARATAGMSRTDTVRYVLATYECGSCHTVDRAGNMGYTARGEESRALMSCCKGESASCIRLLTAVNTTASIPEADRTPDEQKFHQAFNEYGCAFCHKVEAGTMAFTDIGRPLGFMHLGCVELETQMKKGH